MLRCRLLALVGTTLFAVACAIGNPPDDARYDNAVSVQVAMVRARAFLSEGQAKKAVEVLEAELAKVNGNPQYLSMLGDAYRAHIRDLYFANQPDQAKRYLDRLCILEPSAAGDASLKPHVDPAPRKFVAEPAPTTGFQWPMWKPSLPSLPANPFARKEEPKNLLVPKATVRAHSDDVATEDPFDRKSQRAMPPEPSGSSAKELLARGAGEFKQANYAAARACFEQAQKADPSSIDLCREQWAYCIIKGVTETMETPGALPGRLPELKKQVEGAIEMAPTKMMAVGQQLLQTLDQRAKAGPMGSEAVGFVKVRHLGLNKEGWQVAESRSFRIFHKQNDDYAERLAQIAEATRATMYRKWFGHDGIEWEPQCELVLHSNGATYTHMTGVPENSPGHSRIESDAMTGRVVARRMDLRYDITTVLEAVLPHETTHVVLAGNFGTPQMPRWADEGIAVLSEPNDKIDQHRRKLLKNHADGFLFGLKELMELKDYPHPRRISAFYAQSVVLVEFMTKMRGPKVLTDFVKDGVRHGYDTSLQRHYNMTFTQLEQLWQQQVIANTERYAAMK
jgi:tetratricopeptide (TPR) repeat protein